MEGEGVKPGRGGEKMGDQMLGAPGSRRAREQPMGARLPWDQEEKWSGASVVQPPRSARRAPHGGGGRGPT